MLRDTDKLLSFLREFHERHGEASDRLLELTERITKTELRDSGQPSFTNRDRARIRKAFEGIRVFKEAQRVDLDKLTVELEELARGNQARVGQEIVAPNSTSRNNSLALLWALILDERYWDEEQLASLIGVLVSDSRQNKDQLVPLPPTPPPQAIEENALPPGQPDAEAVRAVFAQLLGELQDVIRELSAGRKPNLGLMTALECACAMFDQCCASLSARAAVLGLSTEQPLDLEALGKLAAAVQSAENERDDIRTLLALAAGISPGNGCSDEDLSDFLAYVAETELLLAGGTRDISLLDQRVAPIRTAVRTVRGGAADLSGAERERVFEQLRAYGVRFALNVLMGAVRISERQTETSGTSHAVAEVRAAQNLPADGPSTLHDSGEHSAPRIMVVEDTGQVALDRASVVSPQNGAALLAHDLPIERADENTAPAQKVSSHSTEALAATADTSSLPANVTHEIGLQPACTSTVVADQVDQREGPEAHVPPLRAEPDAAIHAASSHAQDGSATACEGSPPKPAEGIRTQEDLAHAVWSRLEEGQYARAYWLAYHLDTHHADGAEKGALPRWLIEALVISQRTISHEGLAGCRLRDLYAEADYQRILAEAAPREARIYVAFSGALRPLLMAPLCGADRHLKMFINEVPGALRKFGESIAEAAHQAGQPILTTQVLEDDDWKAALEEIYAAVEDFLFSAPQQSLNYQKATAIWREWLGPGGYVYELLEPIKERPAKKEQLASTAASVRSIVGALSDESKIEKLLDRHRREKNIYKPIEGGAVSQFVMKVRRAVDLAQSWLKLLDDAPRDQGALARLEQLRRRLFGLENAVLEQLNVMKRKGGPELASAAAVAQRSVASILQQMKGGAAACEPEQAPLSVLLRELLMTGVMPPGDAEGLVVPRSLDRMVELLARGGELSWPRAFQAYLQRGDLRAARLVLDQIVDGSHDVLEREIETTRVHFREEYTARFEAVSRELDAAMVNGLLVESEIAQLSAELGASPPHDAMQDFSIPLARLDGVRNRVQEIARPRITKCAEDIEALNAAEALKDRVRRVLAANDIGTSYELIALLQKDPRGGLLPSAQTKAAEESPFFPDGLREIERWRRGRTSLLWHPAGIPGFETKRFTSSEVEDTSDVLRRWGVCAADWSRGCGADDLQSFLRWVGFSGAIEGAEERRDRRLTRRFRADGPVTCVLPAFGSEAGGRFRILCVWENPSVEKVLEWASSGNQLGATLVLYFGSMTEDARRSLAAGTRRQGLRLLVLDELLLLYLARKAGERLAAFFQAALPFSFSMPYTPFAAGSMPPEMFVGRKRELEVLLDQRGSCLFYGGRQLGKSALLREAQRRFHKPDEHQWVIYVDLKAEHIPIPMGTERLWGVIGRRLPEPPKELCKTSEPVESRIRAWLEADARRRILILLDEADELLDEDGSKKVPFELVLLLRRWMEDTERRCKVVLAGLHSVQRFGNQPNQPLAHFGEPIAIGPLGPQAALALVTEPLGAMGFRFERPDIALRLLSHTNYQASLIQLFCHELLTHLREAPMDGPPYIIKAGHVDDAYKSQRLQDRIQERFQWTLTLDDRYEALAYIAAHGAAIEKGSARFRMSCGELADEARGWYPAAFECLSDDQTRILLEEMIGLGLLVRDEEGCYRLRSPNILRLLGTKEDIRRKLGHFRGRTPLPRLERQAFRRSLMASENGSSPGLSRRSIFTYEDEKAILKSKAAPMILCFGGAALSEGQFEASLSAIAGEDIRVLVNVEEQERPLDALARWPQSWGDGPVLVGLRASWLRAGSPAMLLGQIQAASELVHRGKGRLRVVWMFDQAETKKWLSFPGQHEREALENSRGLVLVLKQWAAGMVAAYLDENQIDARRAASLMDETGGWPILIEESVGALLAQGDGISRALIHRATTRERLIKACGLDQKESLECKVFDTLAQLGEPVSIGDVCALLGRKEADLRVAVEYLARMRLVARAQVDGVETLSADATISRYWLTAEQESTA